MKIIISFVVPELDDEDRGRLTGGLAKKCKEIGLADNIIISDADKKSIDVNISRVPPASVATLIGDIKNSVKDFLNLDL